MKWISTLKMMRSARVTVTVAVLPAVSGACYSQDHIAIPPDIAETTQATGLETQSTAIQTVVDTEKNNSPLEFVIKPERVKRNQEVLDELYRNIYRYDSGVFNYEKKIN